MRIQIFPEVSTLLPHRRAALLHDASLPRVMRGSVSVHLEKPWIPNFWTVAIRAVQPGGENFFDFSIGRAVDGSSWFFPSRQWWIAHATASHPPDGGGCDVDVHTNFLSREGSAHEFDYATVFTDGTLQVLGRADFVDECSWWSRAFGSRGGAL